MNELALFAGAGGGILGGKLLGWRTVCAVEINAYCRRVLLARQRDGHLERFPIWDDIRTFDGRQWRGHVDVVSGGFPCQDISLARGTERKGLGGERSGLWAEMARVIGEVQPTYVWVENSPALLMGGVERILWDLAAMGYDARWGIVGAHHLGAPHERKRIWIQANISNSSSVRLQKNLTEKILCKQVEAKSQMGRFFPGIARRQGVWSGTRPIGARPVGMGNGVAHTVDRVRSAGNGQVPGVVRLAWQILSELDSPHGKYQGPDTEKDKG